MQNKSCTISFSEISVIRKSSLVDHDQNNVDTVELCSSGPKSNGNLTLPDLTFGPQTSFSLILHIGYNRFWQKRMKVIGPSKLVRAKCYCILHWTSHSSEPGLVTNSIVFVNIMQSGLTVWARLVIDYDEVFPRYDEQSHSIWFLPASNA